MMREITRYLGVWLVVCLSTWGWSSVLGSDAERIFDNHRLGDNTLTLRVDTSIDIVKDGEPVSVIRVDSGASQQVRDAAQTLSDYVFKSTGARLQIRSIDAATSDQEGPGVTLHVGKTPYIEALGIPWDGVESDAFIIYPVDEHNILVVGKTGWGTEFAVYEFLERYVGVRWLMPGENGEDVPPQTDIQVAAAPVFQQPAFISRSFSGINGSEHQDTIWPTQDHLLWARRNRMHAVAEFHHNLLNLIPTSEYGGTHPEFFPYRDGKRHIPESNDEHGWQPCFSAEGLVDVAVERIRRYFDEHPDEQWYSLGINDTDGSCECESCLAAYGSRDNYGAFDASDLYFAWCNAVVERVLETHPDKYFGCLAYRQVMLPPVKVRIHPRIVPFLTDESLKWANAELETQGKSLITRWVKNSSTLGWYDYYYGTPYMLPRVYPRLTAENYRYAQSQGVKAMYAEAYPNFGEGPKLYAALRLQWDPKQDIDDLLDEWYTRAVGAEAAPDLAEYFDVWEGFWTERMPGTSWFQRPGEYLPFRWPEYLTEVSEAELEMCQGLLESVISKTHTQAQHHRAKLLLEMFEFYKASSLIFLSDVQAYSAVDSEQDVMDVFIEGVHRLEMADKRMHLSHEVFPRNVILHQPLPIWSRDELYGEQWGSGYLWRVHPWINQSDAQIYQEAVALSESHESQRVREHLSLMLKTQAGGVENLLEDSSFEVDEIKPWSIWLKDGLGVIEKVRGQAHSGDAAMLFKGVKSGAVIQRFEVVPGRFGAVVYVRCPVEPAGRASVSLVLRVKGGDDGVLEEHSRSIPLRQGSGWGAVVWIGDISGKSMQPEARARCELLVTVKGLGADEQVSLDDVGLYRMLSIND